MKQSKKLESLKSVTLSENVTGVFGGGNNSMPNATGRLVKMTHNGVTFLMRLPENENVLTF